MANLLHIKGSRTKILNSLPVNTMGSDGDMVVSHVRGKGVYLCTKANGRWYTNTKLQDISKTDTLSLRELSTSILKVRNISKAIGSASKFIVSDKNQLKYRTGDEIVDDLSIPIKDIDYKTAYCSFGQYTNKNDCETNGGTWYYSENDSHDSISSTAENQLLTTGSSIGGFDSEPTLLYDGSTLEIKRNADFDDNWQTSAQDALLKLSYDSSNNTIFDVDSSGKLTLDVDGDITLDAKGKQINFAVNDTTMAMIDLNAATFKIMSGSNLNDYFDIIVGSEGATVIHTVDADTDVGHLTLQPDGDLVLDPVSTKIIINATDDLYLDGGGDTYISESSADTISFIAGDDTMLQLSESGGAGNLVNMGTSCAGFTQATVTYNATDTYCYFSRSGNKAILTLTAATLTDLHLIFPNVSCNCVLLLVQDGTGSREITNYKTFDESVGNESTVVFAGGSNPTLTTTASKTDILSFYWDNTNHKAYGTVTHNF